MTDWLDLSVIIIAKNEIEQLPQLFDSLPSGVELILVDSESTDGTADYALSVGAKVFQHPFENYGAQKNFALAQASRSWVLSIDADETLSPALAGAISQVVKQPFKPGDRFGYYLSRQLVFMHRELRFGGTMDKPLRLFRREVGRFIGAIHEIVQVDGAVATLKPGFIKHNSYHDLEDYFQRFNKYTGMVAMQKKHAPRGMKFLAHVLRPWWEFVSRYVFKLGFLDGYPGYVYALNSSLYAFTKYSKCIEVHRG